MANLIKFGGSSGMCKIVTPLMTSDSQNGYVLSSIGTVHSSYKYKYSAFDRVLKTEYDGYTFLARDNGSGIKLTLPNPICINVFCIYEIENIYSGVHRLPISVYASNDDTNYTLLTTLSAPTSDTERSTSILFGTTKYKYYKFVISSTDKYWVMFNQIILYAPQFESID